MFAAVIGDGADRTDGERVIAAKKKRQPFCVEFVAYRAHDFAIPLDDLNQVPITRARRQPRIQRTEQVSAIDDIESARMQRFGDAGDAQGFRTHRRATIAGTDVGGRANERDGLELVHKLSGRLQVARSIAARHRVSQSATLYCGDCNGEPNMSGIVDDILSQLSDAQIGAIAGQLGTDPAQARNAIEHALPLIVGHLAQNASTPQGADARSTTHSANMPVSRFRMC